MLKNVNQELPTANQPAISSQSNNVDVIYYYKGQAYPFYYKKGDTDEFVEDERCVVLQEATTVRALDPNPQKGPYYDAFSKFSFLHLPFQGFE
ncbi:MAG: hypothetical protein ACRBFS_16860 [Aureispira sp.]